MVGIDCLHVICVKCCTIMVGIDCLHVICVKCCTIMVGIDCLHVICVKCCAIMVGIDYLHVISSDCYLDCRALSFWASFNFCFSIFTFQLIPTDRPRERSMDG